MGDNYKGFRIVGTNKKYPEHFEAKLHTGELFAKEMEVCLGQNVALETGLKIGNTFASSHGLDEEGEAHEHLFKVIGIFEANNSVLDQIIVTNLASVWEVHDEELPINNEKVELRHEEQLHADNEHQPAKHEQQITSALIKFRSPMGLMTVPRMVNQSSVMQSAVPAVEINRLFSLLGLGMDTLRWLAMAIILIAGISVFVSLYNSLKERKYEMALMLSMGASRTKLFLLLLSEGLILALVGYCSGILCSRLGLWLISSQFSKKFHQSLEQLSLQQEEIWLLAATLFVGFLAATLPSLGVYRLNISKTLANS
jgi:putative ABC transport system permease protein